MKEQKVDPYPTVGYTCVNERCLKVSSSNPEIKAASFFFISSSSVRSGTRPDLTRKQSGQTQQNNKEKKRKEVEKNKSRRKIKNSLL